MTPERWEQVKRLLEEAVARPAAERAAFLEQAGRGDADLARELESLVAAHDRARGFMVTPGLAPVDAVALVDELRQFHHALDITGSRYAADPSNRVAAERLASIYAALAPAYAESAAVSTNRTGAMRLWPDARLAAKKSVDIIVPRRQIRPRAGAAWGQDGSMSPGAHV